MKRIIWGIAVSVLAAGSARAALLGRSPATPGGSDYQAYYDTTLDITWLADANAAAGSIYDDSGNNTDGLMTWNSAQSWIGSLNAANHLGANDWRLPLIVDMGGPGCDFWAYSGTDCGYNVLTKSGNVNAHETGQTVYSELAHLYYVTLGNDGWYGRNGSATGCLTSSPHCLMNAGPFSNIQDVLYWVGTPAPYPSYAWYFTFSGGQQNIFYKTEYYSAWAVRDSDIGAVPVPGALWLFGTGVAALVGMRRRVRGAGTAA